MPVGRVLRVLHHSPALGLREIARLAELSPSGTKEILAKLNDAQLVEKQQLGQKTVYQLTLNTEDDHFLAAAISEEATQRLQQRSKRYAQAAQRALSWIHDSHLMFQHAKRKHAA